MHTLKEGGMKTLSKGKDRVVTAFKCDGGGLMLHERVRIQVGGRTWTSDKVYLTAKEVEKLKAIR